MSEVSNKIEAEVKELGTAPMPAPVEEPTVKKVRKPRAKKAPAVNVKQLQAENEQLKKILDAKNMELEQARNTVDRLVGAYTKVTALVEQNMDNFVANTKLVLEKGAL